MYYAFVVWDQGQVQILLAIPVCNVWVLEIIFPLISNGSGYLEILSILCIVTLNRCQCCAMQHTTKLHLQHCHGQIL